VKKVAILFEEVEAVLVAAAVVAQVAMVLVKTAALLVALATILALHAEMAPIRVAQEEAEAVVVVIVKVAASRPLPNLTTSTISLRCELSPPSSKAPPASI